MEDLFTILRRTPQRSTARMAVIEANRWVTLGGPNEQLERYSVQVGYWWEDYPRSQEHDLALKERMKELYQEQALSTCRHLELLIAMTYMQKARLESDRASDNWAGDMIGPNEAQIQRLLEAHRTVKAAYDAYHY